MNRLGIALLCVLLPSAYAQSTATLRGDVVDPQGSPVADVIISIQNALTGFSHQVITSDTGEYQLTNLPFQTYSVTAAKEGFERWTTQVALRTNVPHPLRIQLNVAAQLMRIEVSANETTTLVDPEST